MWQVFWRCSPLLSRVTFLRNSRRKPRRPSSPLPLSHLPVVLPPLRFQVPLSLLQHRRLYRAARRSQAPAAWPPFQVRRLHRPAPSKSRRAASLIPRSSPQLLILLRRLPQPIPLTPTLWMPILWTPIPRQSTRLLLLIRRPWIMPLKSKLPSMRLLKKPANVIRSPPFPVLRLLPRPPLLAA